MTPPRCLVDHVARALFAALVVVPLLGVVGAPCVVTQRTRFRADPDKFDLTVSLLRITFPYILFISLVALAAGILNTYSRSRCPRSPRCCSTSPSSPSRCWLAPHFDPPVLALAWAVVLGGVLQLAFQVPLLLKIGMLPRSRPALRRPASAHPQLMGPARSACRSARSAC